MENPIVRSCANRLQPKCLVSTWTRPLNIVYLPFSSGSDTYLGDLTALGYISNNTVVDKYHLQTMLGQFISHFFGGSNTSAAHIAGQVAATKMKTTPFEAEMNSENSRTTFIFLFAVFTELPIIISCRIVNSTTMLIGNVCMSVCMYVCLSVCSQFPGHSFHRIITRLYKFIRHRTLTKPVNNSKVKVKGQGQGHAKREKHIIGHIFGSN